MSQHVVSLKTNIAVWLALLVLTGVTAGVAFIDLGPFNTDRGPGHRNHQSTSGGHDFHACEVCER